jgi:predicted nucleic acid-binding protein
VTVSVDSSAFYAAADAGDVSHARAKAILGSGEALVTTDHVLVESWFLLRSRAGRDAAERFFGALRGGLATIETVLPGDLDARGGSGRRSRARTSRSSTGRASR